MKINSKSAHKNYKGDLWLISTQEWKWERDSRWWHRKNWNSPFPTDTANYTTTYGIISSEETWKLIEQRESPQQRIERRSWDTVSSETPSPQARNKHFSPRNLQSRETSKYRNFLWAARALCSILGSPTLGSFRGEIRPQNSHLWKPVGTVFKKSMEL